MNGEKRNKEKLKGIGKPGDRVVQHAPNPLFASGCFAVYIKQRPQRHHLDDI